MFPSLPSSLLLNNILTNGICTQFWDSLVSLLSSIFYHVLTLFITSAFAFAKSMGMALMSDVYFSLSVFCLYKWSLRIFPAFLAFKTSSEPMGTHPTPFMNSMSALYTAWWDKRRRHFQPGWIGHKLHTRLPFFKSIPGDFFHLPFKCTQYLENME